MLSVRLTLPAVFVLAEVGLEPTRQKLLAELGKAGGFRVELPCRDGTRALRVARAMRAGQVYVNCYGAGGGIELPFGGFGRSGHGREKGFEGLVAFTTTRTLVVAQN